MPRKIPILIENYDDCKKDYILGKQIYKRIYKKKLRLIIENIPKKYYSYKLPIRIITYNSIIFIEKKDETKFKTESNFFITSFKDIFASINLTKYKELNKLLDDELNEYKKKRINRFFFIFLNIVLGVFIASVPALNIYLCGSLVFLLFKNERSSSSFNFLFTLNIYLIILSLFPLIYIISSLIKYLKNIPRRIQIKYSESLNSFFETTDISKLMMYSFQIFYIPLIFIMLEYDLRLLFRNPQLLFGLIYISAIVIGCIVSVYKQILSNRNKKDACMEFLYEQYHTKNYSDLSEKNLLFLVISNLKEKPIIIVKYTKIIMPGLTFLIAIVFIITSIFF